MSLRYRHPPGVEHPPGTLWLVTPRGGAIVLDEALLRLWAAADGRCIDQMRGLPELTEVDDILPHAVGCLAEAGLLLRVPGPEPIEPPQLAPPAHSVSAIVVVSSDAEVPWLAPCLASLCAQQPPPAEIVLVNNGDITLGPITAGRIPVRVHVRRRRVCYAAALNDGTRLAAGDYFLLLNADVSLEPAAMARMLARASGQARVAAVAPKLTFWRAPGFLNGLGNRVRDHDWGTDNAIGQLDLGQFDHWTEVPSGCFAALLISAAAFADVGAFDAGYPAYYEDTDWAYRARALGYVVAAAPGAEVQHAFGTSWNVSEVDGLTPAKHARAAAGRLRFGWKIPARRRQLRVTALGILRELDDARTLKQRGRRMAWAHLQALLMFALGLPSATRLRWTLQRRRSIPDDDLFLPEAEMPASALHGSKPLLTSALIREYYAPLIRSGRTRPLPELA